MSRKEFVGYKDLVSEIKADMRENIYHYISSLDLITDNDKDRLKARSHFVGINCGSIDIPSDIDMMLKRVDDYYSLAGANQLYCLVNYMGFASEDFINEDLLSVNLSGVLEFLDKHAALSDADVCLPEKFYDEILRVKRLKFMIDPMIDGVKSAKKTYQSYKYLGMLESIKEMVDALDESLEESYNAIFPEPDE